MEFILVSFSHVRVHSGTSAFDNVISWTCSWAVSHSRPGANRQYGKLRRKWVDGVFLSVILDAYRRIPRRTSTFSPIPEQVVAEPSSVELALANTEAGGLRTRIRKQREAQKVKSGTKKRE